MCAWFRSIKTSLFIIAAAFSVSLYADNQTPTASPIFSEDELPFRVSIEQADFTLPTGLHSFVFATHNGKWLLLCGRTNGLHGFQDNPNNFPPDKQNTTVFVVDPKTGKVFSRSLTSSTSGLTQDQIDSLSMTSPQFYQLGKTLYITGGYGFLNSIQNYTTFDILTAINVPGLMNWVIKGDARRPASRFIRQLSNEVFRVTGGAMEQLEKGKPTLLVFGQDFEGAYFFGPFTQVYTNQVRRFHIRDNGRTLGVEILEPLPLTFNPAYRRRDLNVPRIVSKVRGKLKPGLVALSGVFTETDGVWTVPVKITSDGKPCMANPDRSRTFKQGMNNYASAVVGLFSKRTGDMYTVLCGGLTYEIVVDGVITPDSDIPFTNLVTTIRINEKGRFKQFLMSGQYPVILSTQSNPGNQLLFGTNAAFIPSAPLLTPDVIDLDRVRDGRVVGYIVGGIESTLPDTKSQSDSAASPYIFQVRILPAPTNSHSS